MAVTTRVAVRAVALESESACGRLSVDLNVVLLLLSAWGARLLRARALAFTACLSAVCPLFCLVAIHYYMCNPHRYMVLSLLWLKFIK